MVDSNVDEEVVCSTPEGNCCAGGGEWTFPAGRTETKCGTLDAPDTNVTCTLTNGNSDTMNRYEGNFYKKTQ